MDKHLSRSKLFQLRTLFPRTYLWSFTRRPKAVFDWRFQADGSSNGVQARLGPADGGYIVTVDWLMGGASISEASSDEH